MDDALDLRRPRVRGAAGRPRVARRRLLNLGEALAFGRKRLRGFGDEGRFDALRLLEEIASVGAATVFAFPERELDEALAVRYAAALERRATGEPVAYIVGHAGFFGRTFAVSPDVLVPRPESEALVRLALDWFSRRPAGGRNPRICDVGTGSGALAITLACERPQAEVVATDVSATALALAERNALQLGVAERVRFLRGDLLDALGDGCTGETIGDETIAGEIFAFDCVVANLPYVATRDLKAAPDATGFEPRLALDGGDDGLALYRRLLEQLPRRIAQDAMLLFEAGPDTAESLAELSAEAFGDAAAVVVHRDYGMRERVVEIRFSS